jgi:metal-dependent hydrolase (beta-lactamase superfamily II)
VLIDAGYPDKEAAVFDAIRRLGRSQDQLKHLIFTHGHPDHIGSAAAIVRQTGARTYLHPLDIPIAENGGPFRPMMPAPGLLARLLESCSFIPMSESIQSLSTSLALLSEFAHRWRDGSYSCSRALCGTGRAPVASSTNALRGRCLHQCHRSR